MLFICSEHRQSTFTSGEECPVTNTRPWHRQSRYILWENGKQPVSCFKDQLHTEQITMLQTHFNGIWYGQTTYENIKVVRLKGPVCITQSTILGCLTRWQAFFSLCQIHISDIKTPSTHTVTQRSPRNNKSKKKKFICSRLRWPNMDQTLKKVLWSLIKKYIQSTLLHPYILDNGWVDYNK